MVTRIDDRFVWMSLGFVLYFATKGIGHLLKREEAHQWNGYSTSLQQSDATSIVKEPEDSIPIEALAVLTRSPNPSIREAAIDVIIQKFAKEPIEQDQFEKDCFAHDQNTRTRAKQLAAFLYPDDVPRVLPPMKCLVLWGLVSESIENDGPAGHVIRMAYHAARERKRKGEKDAWTALHQISDLFLEHHEPTSLLLMVEKINADQVIHWCRAQSMLFKYGKAAPRNPSFAEALRDFAATQSPDDTTDLQAIVAALCVNLEEPSRPSTSDHYDNLSPEEIELHRRRRREVMVLHEGSGAVDNTDLIAPLRSP